ncbi:MAG: hypothetical protein M3Y18_09755, partial [Candidatus Eremiobacteraeota bacterium]|nr:hypothetical protein [Candidatus Eremiobacteraeota bacterium]
MQSLNHARVDAAHLMDGLFVITQGRKDRGKSQNRIVETTFGTVHIKFACVEPLGVTDQTLFLVLNAIAGIQKTIISSDGSEYAQAMHALLQAKDECANLKGVLVATARPDLVLQTQLQDSGTNRRRVDEALERLGNVVVWIYDTKTKKGGNSLLLGVRRDGEMRYVSLNHRVYNALFFSGYIRIDLFERAQIKSDVGLLVHAFFSRWLRVGDGRRKIGWGTLAAHVWIDSLG